MPGKILTAAISLFWLGMMALLVQHDLLPVRRQEQSLVRSPNYRQLEARAEKDAVRQMGIYFAGRRVGQTVTWFSKSGFELDIHSETEISLDLGAAALFGSLAKDKISLEIVFDAVVVEQKLVRFDMRISSAGDPAPLATVSGLPVGDTLKVQMKQGGQTQQFSVPFNPREVISDLFSPAYTPASLKVGAEWTINTFDFMNYRLNRATAKVVGRERITSGGEEVNAFVININYGKTEIKVWASPDGEALRQKFLGFTLVREEPESSMKAPQKQ